MRIRNLSISVAIAVSVAGFAVFSCTTDYVTGKKSFSLVSESQEVAMGKEADPGIVAEYGAYDDSSLARYVSGLGRSLAAKSQRPDLSYTFRVLDSPVVNAFALPGGYVYVTRGILANFDSEDQLAGVLGHEIGHVVARHGAEQMSRQQLAGLGLGLGAVFSETFRKYAETAGVGLQLLLLKYSRAQESESDLLGVEYSTKLGYDANQMAGFFGTLKRMGEKSGQSLPSFMSTHPDPGDREVRVHQLAGEWQKKINYKPLSTDRYQYLKRVDGIVYGEDPRQGFVEGQTFFHPSLRFQFPIPAGWKVINSPSTVVLASSDGKAAVQLRIAEGDSPEKAADSFVSKNELTVRSRKAATVHGFPAVVVRTSGSSEGGEIGVLSYFIRKGTQVFAFHGYSEAAVFESYAGAFSGVMEGFDDVRDENVLTRKPKRVHLRQAPQSGDLASILKSLGVKQGALDETSILNGTQLDVAVEKGRWLKIIGD
jgi:predicted Zn-dependent protease